MAQKNKKNNSPQVKKTAPVSDVKNSLSVSPLQNPVLWMALLPLIAFILYANTLSHGFVLDDLAVITKNKFTHQGFAGFKNIFTTFYWQGFWNSNAGLYRPLSMLMFAAEWQFSHSDKFPDGNPFLFHFMNVLLYAVSVFFLFKMLLGLFPKENILLAVIATLIFIVHPYHTEVVANIKSRDEILCFLFFTLSGIFLLKSVDSGLLKHKIISAAFLFLSLLSKEGGMLFIPVFILMLLMFKKVEWKKIHTYLIPQLAAFALWLLLHEAVIRSSPYPVITYSYMDNSLVAAGSFFSKELTAIGMLGRYIVKSFYPYQFSYDYSFPVIPNETGLAMWPLLGIVFSAAMIFFAVKNFGKNPVVSFSLLFFLITISLTCNVFITIGATMADRFLFVPSLGIALLLSWTILAASKKNKSAFLPLFILAPLFAFYATKVLQRNKSWKNDYELFLADSKSVPNSSRVNYNIGTITLNDFALQQQDTAVKRQMLNDAIYYFKRAVELDPKAQGPWGNLGVAYYKNKNYPAAINAIRTAITLPPPDSAQFSNLGDAFYMNKQYDSSIYYHSYCIDHNIIYKETWNFLGSAYFAKKDYVKALESFQSGVKRDSANSDLWINMGNAFAMNKRYAEALPCFEKGFEINNNNTNAIFFEALTYQNMGDTTNARKSLERYNGLKGK